MLSIVYSTYSTCAYPVTIANRKKRKKEKKKKRKCSRVDVLYAIGGKKRDIE